MQSAVHFYENKASVCHQNKPGLFNISLTPQPCNSPLYNKLISQMVKNHSSGKQLSVSTTEQASGAAAGLIYRTASLIER